MVWTTKAKAILEKLKGAPREPQQYYVLEMKHEDRTTPKLSTLNVGDHAVLLTDDYSLKNVIFWKKSPTGRYSVFYEIKK